VIAIEAIAAAVMTAVGTWWLRDAVSTWHGGRPLSCHPFFRVQPARRRSHIDRCSLTVAIRLGRHPRFLIPPPLR
jgi:hypothetical protein